MTKTGGATGRPSHRPYSWNTDETYCFLHQNYQPIEKTAEAGPLQGRLYHSYELVGTELAVEGAVVGTD